MKLAKLTLLPALLILVALIAGVYYYDSGTRYNFASDGRITSISDGLEIQKPIEDFAQTADIVVRGVPVSRVTEEKQLPLREGWAVDHPLNTPRIRLVPMGLNRSLV